MQVYRNDTGRFFISLSGLKGDKKQTNQSIGRNAITLQSKRSAERSFQNERQMEPNKPHSVQFTFFLKRMNRE